MATQDIIPGRNSTQDTVQAGSYLDRLRDCHYFTPSEKGFVLQFTSLERSGEKKAAVHELPQQNTPEVQDLGNKAQVFPITAIFFGPDYDLTADAFAAGLSEHGPGTLHHPRWGDLKVLPLSWKQSEDFVDGMGRAVFDIEFLRVDAQRFPTSSVSIESGFTFQLNEIVVTASASFVSGYGPVNAADLAVCKKSATGGMTNLLAQVKQQIAQDEELSQQVNAAVAQFNTTIDTLVSTPQAMADSILSICRMPGTAAASISGKINAMMGALANTILSIPGSISQSATQVLQLFGLSLGIVESSLVGTLNDRADSVAAAQAVQDALSLVQSGAEGTEVTGYFVPADVLAQVRAMMAAATALLLEKAFSLRIARTIILTGDRNPLDLVYELAKPADGDALEAALDEFIVQNKLAGEHLFMIPAGTEVTFYG